MARKRINFDLFQLTTTKISDKENHIQFGEVLLKHLNKYKIITQNSSPIVLVDEPHYIGRFIFGTFVHSLMYDLPPIVDNNTRKSNTLPVEKDQGLAYSNSFLYDPELSIIIYESRQNGVSFKSFCEFYENNYQLQPIEANIVINPKSLLQFNEMEYIRGFSVKVTKIQNGSLFNTKDNSIKEVIQAADNTNCDNLEFTIKSARYKHSSLGKKVKNMLQAFLRYKGTDEVQKLEISGKRSEDEPIELIDFITNRLRIVIEVERTRHTQYARLKEKYEAIDYEYQKIRRDLGNAYRK